MRSLTLDVKLPVNISIIQDLFDCGYKWKICNGCLSSILWICDFVACGRLFSVFKHWNFTLFSHSFLHIASCNFRFSFLQFTSEERVMIIKKIDKKALNAMDMKKHATWCKLALRTTQNHLLLTTGVQFINYH